jgi:hypothetical protein
MAADSAPEQAAGGYGAVQGGLARDVSGQGLVTE